MVKKYISGYNNLPKEIKASIWYTVCSFMQKGMAFIVIPIYTRILTTAEYGQYSVFQSWRGILTIFATLNLYCGVFTKAMVDYPEDRDRYISSMQSLSTLITTILFLIYIIFNRQWQAFFEMDSITVILLFLYFLGFPALQFWTVRQRVEYKYIRMVVITLALSLGVPILSVILLFVTDLRQNAVIWGYLIVQSIIGLFFYIYHFVKNHTLYDKSYWVHALKFNVPLIPHYLSLLVLGQSDRIMIKIMCGNSAAGIYSLAYQVALMMNIIITAINGSLVPWLYTQLKEKKYENLKKTSSYLCIFVSVMTVFVICIAPEIIKIIGTDEYLSAIWIMPAVALSVYFQFCYGLFADVEFYYSATKNIMVASIVGAVINVILNYIFIPIFGFVAAGYTTSVCYFLLMLMHFYFMNDVRRKRHINRQLYNVKMIFGISFAMFLLVLLMVLLYRNNIYRYLVIFIIVLVAVIKRNSIIQMFNKMREK